MFEEKMRKFAALFLVFLFSAQLSAEEKVWPACYDKQCKNSDDCCAGAKCLPWIAKMHPKIKETGYCVIEGCKEGDDSTCPAEHTCLKSVKGSFCVKKIPEKK